MPNIVEKLVEAALGGDIAAAKVILDRVLPPLRATDENIVLNLPDTHAERGEAVLRAVAVGELAPTQAAILMQVLDGARMLAEHDELGRRLEVVEKWLRRNSD